MKNPALTERGDPSDNRSSRGNEAHFTQRLWTFACQTALPDDLEHTCVEQVAYWYQNRFRLGLISIPAEGRTFYLAQSDLLPQVQSILKRYERYSL